MLTDSDGLQEETIVLSVPCITICENTERPVTVHEGSKVLAGTDSVRIFAGVGKVLRGESRKGRRPHLWAGRQRSGLSRYWQRNLRGIDWDYCSQSFP